MNFGPHSFPGIILLSAIFVQDVCKFFKVYSFTYRIRSFQPRLSAVHAAFVTQYVLRKDN